MSNIIKYSKAIRAYSNEIGTPIVADMDIGEIAMYWYDKYCELKEVEINNFAQGMEYMARATAAESKANAYAEALESVLLVSRPKRLS